MTAIRADGGLVQIRPVVPADRDSLIRLYTQASDRSIYLRFFSLSRVSVDRDIERLIQPNDRAHRALVAIADDRIVGVVCGERIDETSLEISLLVGDMKHHSGIGTLLLEELAAVARDDGAQYFVADVLPQNAAMLDVITHLGYAYKLGHEDAVVQAKIDLIATGPVFDAMDERDRSAEVASLHSILSPTSIAVIGAGPRHESIGYQVLHNIILGGYTGEVFAVNPHHTQVLGVNCVATAEQLPHPVDLGIVAVPADQVEGVVHSCGKSGMRALIILTAGFNEVEARSGTQEQLVATAHRYGMRVVGPNCLGIVNTDPSIRLNATFAHMPLTPGPLGLVSQSGALGIAVAAAAARSGLGLAQFVSVGNKADVSGNDLLLAWERDPHIGVVGLYLESFGNPRKFARIARRVSAIKPIIALKAGRSAAGLRAGLSHTAAAAASDDVVDALFTRAGVLRVPTMQAMVDAARALVGQPLPGGRRVAIIGNSGGPGILATDTAAAAGLEVVDLAPHTMAELHRVASGAASVENPIDLSAAVSPQTMAAALQVVLDAPEIDAVIAIFTETSLVPADEMIAAIEATTRTADKPVVISVVGAADSSVSPNPYSDAVQVFGYPENAVSALGVLVRYAQVRSTPLRESTHPQDIRSAEAHRLVQATLARGESWLSADSAAALLSCFGIPTCPQQIVTDIATAMNVGDQFGYPLILKLATPGLHKTDVDGVRSDLRNAVAVRQAFTDLRRDRPDVPLLLQPMIPAGAEVIVGAVQDPHFGPLVMLGAGGKYADLAQQRSFRFAPIATEDINEMITEARLDKYLDGFRGGPIVSRAQLANIVVRTAALIDQLPEVVELDLNPLICDSDRITAVDARIRVASPQPHQDPAVRHLR